jgi:undecaprenyl-diphosphatase
MSSTIQEPAAEAAGSDVTGSDVTGSGATEEETLRYVRSPVDVLRLVVFLSISLVLLGLVIGVEDSILGLERDLVEAFGFLSSGIERFLHGTLDLVHILLALFLLVTPLFLRRFRLFGYLITSSLVAGVLMTAIDTAVDRRTPPVLVNRIAERAGIDLDIADGIVAIAQMTAMFIAVAPFVTRRWRRAGMILMAVLVVGRLIVSPRLPVDLLLALPVGAFVGTAVLLAFGRPDRRPTLAAIRGGLEVAGLRVSEVHPASVDARGSTPYFATLHDGTGLFVKVLGSEERAADLLFRVYRFLRLKDVGDGRPFSSLRRTIEHEALVSLMARDVDVLTPRLRGVVDVGADSMLLAYEQIDGSSLDSLDDDEVTDELMGEIWEQVALLRRHRIAHRDLRRANVFVAADGRVWMIDFGFSELAVSDELLDADAAQMLASLSVVVGVGRAVSSAVGVMGAETIGACLPRLQLTALSGATQTALKEHKGRLEELQNEVIEQCSVEKVEYAELERVSKKAIVMIAALALATYFLIPQIADLPGIARQVSDANWAWTPLIIVASTMSYVGATGSLAGCVPERLRAGPLFVASVASSFASKLAPAGLGGMALSVRYLQKQGIERAVAVSGVGLNTIGGLFGHISLVGIFIVWAGRDAFGSFSLPDPKWFVLSIGIAAGLLVIGFLIRPVRQLMMRTLVPVLARAFDGVTAVLRQPSKVLLLIGGSALVTFSYLCTFYFSVEAFGGGLPFATVGAVFLVGSAVAQAAPTPGGLGAMEAALIGGLVAAGLDNTIAVPAVFLYRLFTFWIPVLPGWFAFQWLERNEYL